MILMARRASAATGKDTRRTRRSIRIRTRRGSIERRRSTRRRTLRRRKQR